MARSHEPLWDDHSVSTSSNLDALGPGRFPPGDAGSISLDGERKDRERVPRGMPGRLRQQRRIPAMIDRAQPDPAQSTPAPILVTGATGYVGGRLVSRLLEAGHRVRCLARAPGRLAARSWASDPRVEIAEADLRNEARTATAMSGCGAVDHAVAAAAFLRRPR
jgi:hypothetical protein